MAKTALPPGPASVRVTLTGRESDARQVRLRCAATGSGAPAAERRGQRPTAVTPTVSEMTTSWQCSTLGDCGEHTAFRRGKQWSVDGSCGTVQRSRSVSDTTRINHSAVGGELIRPAEPPPCSDLGTERISIPAAGAASVSTRAVPLPAQSWSGQPRTHPLIDRPCPLHQSADRERTEYRHTR